MKDFSGNSTALPVEDDGCHFDPAFKGICCSLLAAIGLCAIIENLLFCHAVYCKSSLRRKSMVLVVSLSISDILISLFIPTLEFWFTLYYPKWPLRSVGTDIYNSAWMFSVVSPFTTVTAITIERYLAISKPGFYRRHWSSSRMKMILVFLWSYSFGWVSILALTLNPIKGLKYSWNVNHAIYYVFIWFHVIVPLILIPILYYRIYRSVKSSRTNVTGRKNSLVHTNQNTDIKLVTTVAYVISFLLFIWIPVLGLETLYTSRYNTCTVKQADVISVAMASFNCCLNPFIYSYKNKDIQEYLRELKQRVCCISFRSRNGYDDIEPDVVKCNRHSLSSSTSHHATFK